MNKQLLTMPFGKYRGEAIEDVPASYLLWMHENVDDLDLHINAWIEEHEDELKVAAKDEKKFNTGGYKRRY